MIGFAKWQYPLSLTAEQEAEKKWLDDTEKESLPLPEEANKEAYEAFFGPLYTKQKQHLNKKEDYCRPLSLRKPLMIVLTSVSRSARPRCLPLPPT